MMAGYRYLKKPDIGINRLCHHPVSVTTTTWIGLVSLGAEGARLNWGIRITRGWPHLAPRVRDVTKPPPNDILFLDSGSPRFLAS